MKTTITKSARQSAGKATRIQGIPADTNPVAALSFVKRRWDGRSKFHRVIDWLDVPLETREDGNITGYRVTAELMAWASEHPSTSGHTLQSVLEAAQAVLAQPFTQANSKRGAAASIVSTLISLLVFAAKQADHADYCEREIAAVQKRKEQEAKERCEFIDRMKAARAAKRLARTGGAA